MFLGSRGYQLFGIDPSRFSGLETFHSFGPKLIAIAPQFFNFYGAAANRPEPPASDFIFEVCVRVNRAYENAVSGRLDKMPSVGRTETIGLPTDERLDPACLRTAHCVQLGQFDDPWVVNL